MNLDVRTMYVAVAAACFVVAVALFALQTRRSRRDGAFQWATGWALQGVFWVFLALRGVIPDFLSITVAITLLTASYSFLYAAVRRFQERPHNTTVLFLPVAVTFLFMWYFSAYTDNLIYRALYISFLSVLQIGAIVFVLFRNVPGRERSIFRLTGLAFFAMGLVWFVRLLEVLVFRSEQLFTSDATFYRNANTIVGLCVVVLSSIGFMFMLRERAEETLRRSEKRFRSLFETCRDGILLINQDAGRIIGANDAACRLYGYSAEEILLMRITDLSAEPEKTETSILQSISEVPYRLHRKKDGTSFPVEISGSYFTEGNIRLHTAFIRDITERTRVEEKLRESRLQLAEAADLAKIAYWEHDSATDEFIFNDQFYELYGTTAAREGGYRMSREEYQRRFVHPDDLEELNRQIAENASHPRADDLEQYEHRGIRADGEDIYILDRNRVVLDAGGRVIKAVGVNQDITGRKKMEEALRESEAKFRAVLESSRDAITVSKGGIRTYVNPAYVSLFGFESADELVGKRIVDSVAPESRALVAELVAEHSAGVGAASFYEQATMRKDGSKFLAEVTVASYAVGAELFSVAILRDITDRKRAEEEVRLLKHSIDVHYDGAYWMNTDNEFVYVNEAACKALGYDREELIGRKLFDVNPEGSPEGMAAVWETIRKEGSFVGESVHRRKDGSEFPVEIVTTYVRFEGREYLCGFARDISEKRRLEEQLRQAQKMEAVGTLAGGVAHDFNNILTVIMGLGNLLQMGLGKDNVNRPYADQIVASSERAADLTQSLLAFSRKQRITLATHTVNGVVASTAKLLVRLLPEDIGLDMSLTEEDTSSRLDVSQIGQVLMNLATNARDAMPQGGSLRIGTERVRLDESFRKAHGFGRTGEYVKLSVSDTGIGMDRQVLEHIFEPFFTTKEVGKGTGLGLASAYGTVKQHLGYITVSSTPGAGTTFDIYLPCSDAASIQGPLVKEQALGGSETVLVVEDDRDVRYMLTSILESHGYETIEAVDGDDAIRVHHANRERIDLIILDVVMPGKNGKEALEEIARSNPHVKAIFTSGYTGEIVIDKGVRSESVDFLRKPITVTGLLTKVREVLDR